MNDPGSLSRRRFLYVAGAGSIAAVGVGLALRRTWQSPDVGPFLDLLDDPSAARKLGTVWIADSRRQHDAAELIEELHRDLGPTSASATPSDLRRLVAERIRGDFADGRVGRIGNWVLSETEIRLCALAALNAPG